MPYQSQKQTQTAGRNEKPRLEKPEVQEQRSFGIPNSLTMAMPATPPGTPNSIMREMGTDNSLFRGRGFDPSVGAHELFHTVRSKPVPVAVSRTVPSGTIQRSSAAGGGWESRVSSGSYPGISGGYQESSDREDEGALDPLLEHVRKTSMAFMEKFNTEYIQSAGNAMRKTGDSLQEKDPESAREWYEMASCLENAPSALIEVISLVSSCESGRKEREEKDVKYMFEQIGRMEKVEEFADNALTFSAGEAKQPENADPKNGKNDDIDDNFVNVAESIRRREAEERDQALMNAGPPNAGLFSSDFATGMRISNIANPARAQVRGEETGIAGVVHKIGSFISGIFK